MDTIRTTGWPLLCVGSREGIIWRGIKFLSVRNDKSLKFLTKNDSKPSSIGRVLKCGIFF